MAASDPSPTAAGAASANVAMWRLVARAVPGASVEEASGAAAVVTGVESATENGVWVLARDVDPAVVETLLERVAARRLPHCLWLREGTDERVIGLAARRGMRRAGAEPLMIARTRPAPRAVPGLSIRRLSPDEARLHARVAAPVFGSPPEAVETLVNPALLALPEVRCYAGEAGGEPVATAVGVTLLGCTAVFGVATLPEHRGRGYGAALTAAAARDGFDAGARWAWLQSSPQAERLYRRLGFAVVETQPFWIAR